MFIGHEWIESQGHRSTEGLQLGLELSIGGQPS